MECNYGNGIKVLKCGAVSVTRGECNYGNGIKVLKCGAVSVTRGLGHGVDCKVLNILLTMQCRFREEGWG